jgi:hypothetical protein
MLLGSFSISVILVIVVTNISSTMDNFVINYFGFLGHFLS